MNKSEVCDRPGSDRGPRREILSYRARAHPHGDVWPLHRVWYSLPQILEAEQSSEWRKAAAKYLRVAVNDLEATIASLLAEREARRIAAEARAASLSAELRAKREAEEAEQNRLAAIVRGGLRRIGCPNPLSDGWRRFEVTEVLEYVEFADRRGRIDGDYIREFYRLWSAGAGYCNPKGVLRRLIAPVKNRLVRILLYMARKNGWVYGVGSDNRDGRVLYIDTSRGQVSFHLMRYESADYPSYAAAWSGVRNSDEILSQLFDSLHQTQATEIAA